METDSSRPSVRNSTDTFYKMFYRRKSRTQAQHPKEKRPVLLIYMYIMYIMYIHDIYIKYM